MSSFAGFDLPLAPEAPFCIGHEPTGDRAVDFWAWGFGNLGSNATRGVLAEFIVARALGIELGLRDEWANHDLVMADGTTIEVKSSAYVQAWKQRAPSNIAFTGLKARRWTVDDGYVGEPEYRSALYVFALHTARTLDGYDPMDLSLWRFWVLPRETVAETGQKSLALGRIEELAGTGWGYAELGEKVRSVYWAPSARDANIPAR